MPQFRRGAAEIEKSTQRKSGGSFGRFAPSIYWTDDKEAKYLWFLNTIEDIPRLDMINFIPVKNDKGERMYYASVIARSDACFEEDAVKEDRLVTEWDAPVKDSNLFVAVELEPVMEEKRGRPKPVGFTIKTIEFERRVRDDDGELTDETETVTAPAYGFIQESASNFGAVLQSHDATEFPIEAWPIKVQRIGADKNTKYNVVGYEDMEVDPTPFLENLDGISYLGDKLDEVKEAVAGIDDPRAAVLAVGTVLLEERLNELADEDRYNRLADGVTETLDRFGSKKKQRGAAEKKSKGSQRSSASETTSNGNGGEPEPKRGQKSSDAMEALKALQATAKQRSK